MTKLDKPVRRRTRSAYNVLYCGGNKAREIVVAILPGDVLEFRESGRRGRWYLAIDTAFRYAVRVKAFTEAAEKGKQRKSRKVRRR